VGLKDPKKVLADLRAGNRQTGSDAALNPRRWPR
jgi:hypothetical protein